VFGKRPLIRRRRRRRSYRARVSHKALLIFI